MSPTGRVLIPLLFVVLIIVLLGRPILISGLELDEDDPGPVPTVRPTEDGRDDPKGPTRLATPYPRACLEETAAPAPGLVAAFSNGSVTAAAPQGGTAFALRVRPPVGWSPSGRFLATAGADLWSNRGDHIGVAFSRPVGRWAWSPVADCIMGVERDRLVVAQPRRAPTTLLRGIDVSTFTFSPDGSRLAFSVKGSGPSSGVWMADLETREIKFLQPPKGWVHVAWTRAMRPILLPGPGTGLTFTPSDEVANCGDEIVTVRKQKLATFGVTGVPKFIRADLRLRYEAVACAPSGSLLVAIGRASGRGNTSMVVLRPDGTFVREVAQQSIAEDLPMWGPGGVVFAGSVGGEGAAGPFVWFLAEGGTAQPSGLRVDGLGSRLDAWLDWSGTPPVGHPTG